MVELSRNICAHPYTANIKPDAQNGKTYDTTPTVRADCGGGEKKRGRHRRR